MLDFHWDVQKIREIPDVEEHTLIQCITVDTSRLVARLERELQDEESSVDFIVEQMQLLIDNVFEKVRKSSGVSTDRSLVINLNFTHLKFSVAYWDILLERALDQMNGSSKTEARYFITEATSVERGQYIETNQYFQSFKANQRLERDSVDTVSYTHLDVYKRQVHTLC